MNYIKNINKVFAIKIKYNLINELQITPQFKIIIKNVPLQNYLKTIHPLFNIFIRQHIRCTLPSIQFTEIRIYNYL
ncbi:hypothetical protein D5066_14620 [Enterobacter chuandaensis]|nr:hypothetical protein D5066_14620 [Enterobacter chuandaensis]